jgi:hypothetical protein
LDSGLVLRHELNERPNCLEVPVDCLDSAYRIAPSYCAINIPVGPELPAVLVRLLSTSPADFSDDEPHLLVERGQKVIARSVHQNVMKA